MKTTDDRIAELVQPLKNELDRIDVEIENHQSALTELRGARKRITDILKHADPKPKRRQRQTTPRARGDALERNVIVIREFIEQRQIQTVQIRPLWRLMDEDGRKRGWSPPSEEITRKVVHAMHERGELRLVAKGRGGSKIFALVNGGTNGSA